jgi:hypothetical protein
MKQENNTQICILYAHLALLYQNHKPDELTAPVVTMHIIAHLVLNIR